MASSPQYPGWAYMLAGVAIGLFASFLFYLHKLPDPGKMTKHTRSSEQPAPKFEFYDILPELEVVVPELGVLKNKKDDKAGTTTQSPPKVSQELQAGESFVLQVGSFQDRKQADKLKATLALLGLEAYIQQITVDNKSWHRVRVGPYTDRRALNVARQRLQENDIQAITLKISS